MKTMIHRLRMFLIKLLAGDDLVIVNADLHGCPLMVDSGHALCIGCRFSQRDEPIITVWPRAARDEMKRRMRELRR